MIFLGIDCGTQSTKTVAIDIESGRVLASAQKGHEFVAGLPPGAMEQRPQDWSAAAGETIGHTLRDLGARRSDVRGIGVSGQQHGLVPICAAGEVVRPAKLWCDTTTTAQCDALTQALGGRDRVINLVGNAMLPGYTAPKILWLRENEPENWERTRTFLLPHDYLNFWLTGHSRMEFGDASGTALVDVRAREWSDPVVDAVGGGLAEKLPALGSSLQSAGMLRDALRREWSLPREVTVSAGGGDNMMAAIGTDNTAPGAVTASLGTSGTLFAFAAQPVIDPRGEVAGFCDSTDHWLPLVCTMNVTLVTELARAMFGWSHAEFDEAVGRVPAGAEGLTLLPYLAGERTPNLPRGCGVLHGIRTENFTSAHVARAIMEGVTLGLGYGLDRLRALGIEATEIRLTGGGSNSAAWRQVCADVFGAPVVCLENSGGASLGAALQAAWLVAREHGSDASLADLTAALVKPDASTRAEPQADAAAVYAEQLERMHGLRSALASTNLL
ncbi:MAG: xylulokinase [Terrimicrobiaceae bacterium]|nr:xylulokinase [Terrimicrobiaceae bacterium]